MPRGRTTILTVEVTTDGEGKVDVLVDTEQPPAVVVALLEQVIEHVGAPDDRASEVGAFGARRRGRGVQ